MRFFLYLLGLANAFACSLDILDIETPAGNYGYHFDMAYWDYFHCKEIEKAKPWDGYTNKDARRLFALVNERSDKNDYN